MEVIQRDISNNRRSVLICNFCGKEKDKLMAEDNYDESHRICLACARKAVGLFEKEAGK